MSLIIFVLGVLNLAFSYLFLKKTSWILLLIQAYWFFWMFLSSFSLTGLFIPSNYTYSLYIMLLSSVTTGAGVAKFWDIKMQNKTRLMPRSLFGLLTKDKEKYYFYFILIFILPIVLFFLSKSIYINLKSDAMHPSGFRAYAYGVYGESILFGKNKYLYYYSLVVTPIIFASLFLGAAFYLRLKKMRILILGVILTIMETLMFLGRFGFYYVLIVLILVLVIKVFRNRKSFLNSISLIHIFIVTCILLGVFFISAIRNSNWQFDFREFLNIYIIDYHTESFSIFDSELKDEKSLLHERTYGRASLGTLESSFSVALAFFRIPLHIQVQSDLIGEYLNKNRIIGYSKDGRPKEYNAFGSILFTLYKDGGIPFIIGMGILFGFCVAKFSKSFISLNPYYVSLLASLFFVGIFGIFKPVMAEQITQTIFILWFIWLI
ncbi:O-antigen polymerase [Leptospira santarosai]|uniref:O-antigen polymerase n=1 Tax=Leptospira santarosai TaxID=28183 RepID=UPI0002BE06D3|nr:O-antigen polymerase [Leptospira santarosai]EMP81409.1 oligosaccharide repeat unit polymerase [Leptospira santarosai str. CBC1531]